MRCACSCGATHKSTLLIFSIQISIASSKLYVLVNRLLCYSPENKWNNVDFLDLQVQNLVSHFVPLCNFPFPGSFIPPWCAVIVCSLFREESLYFHSGCAVPFSTADRGWQNRSNSDGRRVCFGQCGQAPQQFRSGIIGWCFHPPLHHTLCCCSVQKLL